MNSNFPNDDDLIRRASRNVRKAEEEPETSFKDASDAQVAKQKADYEKDEPPKDEDVHVVCGTIDKDGNVRMLPPDTVPDSVRQFIDDLTGGAFSMSNPPKKRTRKKETSDMGEEFHKCSEEELAEVEKAVDNLENICQKYHLPGTAMVQICNTPFGFGARGFRYRNERIHGRVDLFQKIGDVLFAQKPPKWDDMRELAEVVARMLRRMKGDEDNA